MSKRFLPKRSLLLGLLAALALSLSAPALAADSVKIDDLVIAATIPDAQREATLKAVRAFYDFWNTGDEALLKEAIAPNFTDHTLPPGCPVQQPDVRVVQRQRSGCDGCTTRRA